MKLRFGDLFGDEEVCLQAKIQEIEVSVSSLDSEYKLLRSQFSAVVVSSLHWSCIHSLIDFSSTIWTVVF